MTFEDLEAVAAEWAEIVPKDFAVDGPIALLKTARRLFVHSWFDYEFMVVACLLGFQALDASFRLLYPDAKPNTSLRRLVEKAEKEQLLEPKFVELAKTGVDLRNLLSHPKTAAAFTSGMADGILENTHRLVVLVVATARQRGMDAP
jgi:hypothetical protein